MPITWEQVAIMCPDVARTPVPAQAMIIEHVNSTLDETLFGALAKMAAIYLAAHIATGIIRAIDGQSGPVVSESIGGASISYAAYIGGSTSDLDASSYGRLYRGMLPVACGFLVGGC